MDRHLACEPEVHVSGQREDKWGLGKNSMILILGLLYSAGSEPANFFFATGSCEDSFFSFRKRLCNFMNNSSLNKGWKEQTCMSFLTSLISWRRKCQKWPDHTFLKQSLILHSPGPDGLLVLCRNTFLIYSKINCCTYLLGYLNLCVSMDF